MTTLLIALVAMAAFGLAYHTYGRWLARRVFALDPNAAVPSIELQDDVDYVPTKRGVIFGHHFTSIAGTGPIVGPAIAVMWGWLPALLWIVLGSIFFGAVHDFGALVVSLRNRGQTVGDVAGRLIGPRVRILFLLVLFMALTIVLAIFGLVIAAVFKKYPAAIFPCVVQIPLAMMIGIWLHRRGVHLLVPSVLALAGMYLTVLFGNVNFPFDVPAFGLSAGEWGLKAVNEAMASWSLIAWVIVLLTYSYAASVLPVWTLLQPRDYINSLQLISALALVVAGLFVAALAGGAPVDGSTARPPLTIASPAYDFDPSEAPLIFPFLFITIARGAISGFHCLVSSGTSSKQLACETDAQFVGYGSMLTEGFLATLVVLACCSGIGLGIVAENGSVLTGSDAWQARYASWGAAQSLGAKVGAFVDGSANFLKALGMPPSAAVALMGVLVASFAGTTLDTACRLQRYVVQELAGTFAGNARPGGVLNPIGILRNKHGATIFAVLLAFVVAVLPPQSPAISLGDAFRGSLRDEVVAEQTAAGTPPAKLEQMQTGGLAGSWAWMTAYGGRGGLILWPMFGATNQLLGGLAFLVIFFWLWRRNMPTWFIAIPMLFMIVMPAWAMLYQFFVQGVGMERSWWEEGNWPLIAIAIGTLLLEAWMLVEAALVWPKVRGVVEETLPPLTPNPKTTPGVFLAE